MTRFRKVLKRQIICSFCCPKLHQHQNGLREVNIALTQEINGKWVILLPCLIEDCEIPLFLIDKKDADFRYNSRYVDSWLKIVKALGLSEKSDEKLFLDQHIFYDLKDLNDGFDVETIRYLNKMVFEKVLKRAEFFRLEIYGIEPWPNRQFC